MQTSAELENLDLAIIGGGPAALSAAIYTARAGLKVQVFEKADFGGILPVIPQLENYPGFVGEGKVLAERMAAQAKQAGAKLSYGECTQIIKLPTADFSLVIDQEPVLARSVIIATGSEPKQLDFAPNTPVSYCALCDGALARGKRVVVVGGANSAVQEALYLANLASEVVIVTHSKLKADQELQDRLQKLANVKIIEQTEPTTALLNQYDFCFVYIGKTPATKFLQKLAQQYALLSRDGYVLTDQDNPHYPHQTVVEGLFAAGDVRLGATKQVITASADGVEAAIEVGNWLRK